MRTKERIFAIFLTVVMIISMIGYFDMPRQTRAAESFAITSPENNKLIGAGHFDIKWSQPTDSSVKTYKLYVDDQMIASTSDTSYEYYTTTVKKYSAYVVAEYSDGTSESTDKINFWVTKKGLCANEEMAKYLEPLEMNVGWYYNWKAEPHSYYDAFQRMEYVPMIWGTGNEGSIPSVAAAGYKHLLAYNEPDMGGDVGGSKIDVNTAISHWGNFQGYDYRLGTPAPALSPSWDNGTWFRTFMDGINHDTVDFIALHCYYWQYTGKEAAETFLREVVDKTYEMYHKPIWITEFAVDGWAYGDAEHSESVKEFMKTAIDGLNSRDYVERFAWFSFNTTDTNNGIASLYNYETGDLTDLGRTYVGYGNPEGYVSLPLAGQDYTLCSAARNQLLDDTVVIDGVNYKDYIKEGGVSAVSSSDEESDRTADKAIDEDINTRWASIQKTDPSNLTLDLGQIRSIKQINIIWEVASAREYNIEVSSDGQNFTRIAEEKDGISYDYKNDTIILNRSIDARYIRINGTSRSTDYGYSIWDIAVYGNSVQEPPTTEETTEEETTTESNVELSEKVKVEGYQISAVLGGNRVVGSVEPEINGQQVLKWGFVYALESLGSADTGVTNNDVYVGSDNEYVASYESTSLGKTNIKFGESDTVEYFVRTMLFASGTAQEFTSRYKVRSYAQLADGSYVYSNIYTYSVYEISDCLYQNKMMSNFSGHEYLYNNILKVVNQAYIEVDYDWSDILA